VSGERDGTTLSPSWKGSHFPGLLSMRVSGAAIQPPVGNAPRERGRACACAVRWGHSCQPTDSSSMRIIKSYCRLTSPPRQIARREWVRERWSDGEREREWERADEVTGVREPAKPVRTGQVTRLRESENRSVQAEGTGTGTSSTLISSRHCHQAAVTHSPARSLAHTCASVRPLAHAASHSDLSFARDSSIGSRVNSPRRRRCDSEVVN